MLYLIHTVRQFPIQCTWRSTLFKSIARHSSSSKGGPSREKLKAIPFAQHVKAAEKVKYIETIRHEYTNANVLITF